MDQQAHDDSSSSRQRLLDALRAARQHRSLVIQQPSRAAPAVEIVEFHIRALLEHTASSSSSDLLHLLARLGQGSQQRLRNPAALVSLLGADQSIQQGLLAGQQATLPFRSDLASFGLVSQSPLNPPLFLREALQERLARSLEQQAHVLAASFTNHPVAASGASSHQVAVKTAGETTTSAKPLASPTEKKKAATNHSSKPPTTKSGAGAPLVHHSERKGLVLSDISSPQKALKVLKILGTTLRTKVDPYIDATKIKIPAQVMQAKEPSNRGGIVELFPYKVYRMLAECEANGLNHIVSWLPHSRAFTVHDRTAFVNTVMPRYFDQNRWPSFSRQLNLYGFCRVSSGPDSGAYYHELFLKGYPDLIYFMRRTGVPKDFDRRSVRLPEGSDPDFYSMALR